jgi:peptidoglycan DL-endopeptidase CwlO
VEFLPQGRYGQAKSRGIRNRKRARRAWGRAAIMASAAVLASAAIPAGIGLADSGGGKPTSLQATVAMANKLSEQIDALGQQFDGLRIELTQARSEAKIAHETALRDERALSAGQTTVGQIAAEGYMNLGFSPTLQLLQSSDPQQLLNRASIMVQLNHQQGGTVNLLAEAEAAANRAVLTAKQETILATHLSAAMARKVAQIQAKENVLNSSAYAQALAQFQKTGTYPNIAVRGDSVGAQALRWALSRVGDWYVWGGAGPDVFDCSGLVMWSYAHVGISLAHLTFDQWNEGEHISKDQLQPGDLLFFFGLDHVGMYVGGGLMVDAPTQGQKVQVQPVFWGGFDGAVRVL